MPRSGVVANKSRFVRKELFTITPLRGCTFSERDGADVAAAASGPGSKLVVRFDGTSKATVPPPINQLCASLREAVDPDHRILKGFDVRVYAQGVCTTGEALPPGDPDAIQVPFADPAAVNSRHIIILPAPSLCAPDEDPAVTAARAVNGDGRVGPASRRDIITLSTRASTGAQYTYVDLLVTTGAAVTITAAGATCLSVNFNGETSGIVPNENGRRIQRFSRNPRSRIILIVDALNSPEGMNLIYNKLEKLVSRVAPKEFLAQRALELIESAVMPSS